MKQRVEYGEIVKFNGGSVQLKSVSKKMVLIVSGRFGEVEIPIEVINTSLEDSWRFERTSRGT